MNTQHVLDTIHEILNELKIKFSWDGRAYLETMLLNMIQCPQRKTNTKRYEEVSAAFGNISIDAVERSLRYMFTHLDYTSPLAQKLFHGVTTKVAVKEGLYAIHYELTERLK